MACDRVDTAHRVVRWVHSHFRRCANEDLKLPKDPYYRPHSFAAGSTDIVVPMKALSPVTVTVTDETDAPIKDLFVAASPNVGWWNYGSQIYADYLAKGKNILEKRNGMNALDKPFPSLFEGNTDSRGSITLQLPAEHNTFLLGMTNTNYPFR